MPAVEGLEDSGEAKAGRVPVHIYWQIQHAAHGKSGAELAHLYVFDGSNGILLEQRPEAAVWDTIRQDWDRFMALVRADQPPPLTERDTVIRTDKEWIAAAQEYIELKERADETAAGLDELPSSSSSRSPGIPTRKAAASQCRVTARRDDRLQEGAGAGRRGPGAGTAGPAREETRVSVLKWGQRGTAAMPFRIGEGMC